MTPDEIVQLKKLADQIITEKDPATFNKLVLELNELLEAKHQRIDPGHAQARTKPNREEPH